MPLVFPAVSTGAIICFVLSIADFGTPAILGRGFRTLSTIALGAYRSELGGAPTMAVTVSLLMMASMRHWLYSAEFSLAICKFSYKPASTCEVGRVEKLGYSYFLSWACLNSDASINCCDLHFDFKTKGPVFVGGFGFESYQRIWRMLRKRSLLFSLKTAALYHYRISL